MLEMIKVNGLSTQELVLKIYQCNDYYFSKTTEIIPSLKDVVEDSLILPPNVSKNQKKYCLLKYDRQVVGMIDLIENFPERKTNFIGLFMIDKEYQGKGYGTKIINELFELFKKEKKDKVRLAVILENKKAMGFWKKQDFSIVEEKEIQLTKHLVKRGVVMEKSVGI